MHNILRTDLEKQDYIKCPICHSIYPKDVEFCILCGTEFDKETIEKIKGDSK